MSSLFISLVIALAGFLAGWQTNGWRLGLDIQSLKVEHSQEQVQLASKAAAQQTQMLKDRDALASKLAALDADYTTQLNKARHDNETLRNRIAAGSTGLRIQATCSQPAAGSAAAAQGGGVDPAAGAELTAAAGHAYSALRENITTTEVTLAACQSALARFQ